MENWLLIIVGVIFLVGIVAGAVRGFVKIGISLLSTVLIAALFAFLSPHVGSALAKYTPLDDLIQEKIVQAFLPEISAETLKDKDLSGTPLQDIPLKDIEKLTSLDWKRFGITTNDFADILGNIPKDQQIREIEEAAMPDFLKDLLLENKSVYAVSFWTQSNTLLSLDAVNSQRKMLSLVLFF